jgi:hypothetical protein
MIYARHGYRFNSQDLILYFNRFDWYNPRFENVDNLFTDVDKYNIQLIQAFENRNENLQNIIWHNPAGVWQDGPIMNSGWSNRFVIHTNGQMEFYFSQMSKIGIGFGMNGNYTIRGNVLIYSVTQVYFIMNDSEINYSAMSGYQWRNTIQNTFTLEKPIVYKFPVSNIAAREIFKGLTRETVTIGRDFFKMRDDINDKF